MGSQGEEGLVGPREAPHPPRSPRAFGPQPEVFSELNPNPSWGPDSPQSSCCQKGSGFWGLGRPQAARPA